MDVLRGLPGIARHHLAVLSRRHGEAVTDHRLDHVLEGFTEVTAHEDVAPGLERLRAAGVTVVTMTNGMVEITRGFLRRENLEELVAATYDVEMVGRWKPSPEPYRHMVEKYGLGTTEAALIAVHPCPPDRPGWLDRPRRSSSGRCRTAPAGSPGCHGDWTHVGPPVGCIGWTRSD